MVSSHYLNLGLLVLDWTNNTLNGGYWRLYAVVNLHIIAYDVVKKKHDLNQLLTDYPVGGPVKSIKYQIETNWVGYSRRKILCNCIYGRMCFFIQKYNAIYNISLKTGSQRKTRGLTA